MADAVAPMQGAGVASASRVESLARRARPMDIMPSAVPRGTTEATMDSRKIVGVLALIVAAIVLVFFLMSGDDKKTESAKAKLNGKEKVMGSGPASGDTATGAGRVGGTAGTPLPHGENGATGTSGTREYYTDTGNRVRDHREGVVDPKAVPAPLPPEQRTLSSVITADIYRSLAPIVRGCGNDVDAAAKGPSPVVHVTLGVDIEGEKLTTFDATAVVSDVSGPAADRVIACVRDRAAGLTVAAKGEPDRSNYVVQYPIRIR